jgi:hypothetical protein
MTSQKPLYEEHKDEVKFKAPEMIYRIVKEMKLYELLMKLNSISKLQNIMNDRYGLVST